MKILVLLLYFVANMPEPSATLTVRTKEDAAVMLWQHKRSTPATTAKLYEFTITPAGIVGAELVIPVVSFSLPQQQVLPTP